MAIFKYKGFDARTGANRKGKIEAESLKAAKAKLKKTEKINVSEIKEETLLRVLEMLLHYLDLASQVVTSR